MCGSKLIAGPSTKSMLTTIWNKRKALTTARALVDEGRWRELLDLHATSRIGDVDAALLPLMLLVALELEDERYIREIVDRAQRQTIRASVALGLVGHLINSGRTDEAWHILRRTDPADTLDRFVVLERLSKPLYYVAECGMRLYGRTSCLR